MDRILGHLQVGGGEEAEDLAARMKRFGRIKGERGRKAVADALGLQEAELPFFDAALRDVERTWGRREEGDAQSERNAGIAAVRLLSWFETVAQRTPELALDAEVEALVSEDLGRKQVRALELIVRSLITESYGDQEALVARLRQALSEQVVARWQAGADPGDILSGCTFSELAGLFVSKEEFARYERLYEDTPFLTLLKQRRKTIQNFLDDVRRIRNALAHNKRITATQLSLLDLYYEEIVTPVQTAHDEGETKVDPAIYLDVSKEDLEGYFDGLREDVRAVRDDLGELRQDVMDSLGVIATDTAAIRETTRGVNRKLVLVAAGVLILIGAAIFLAVQGGETREEATRTRETAERTETAARETAETTREIAQNVEEATETNREVAERVEEATEATEAAAREMQEASEQVVQTLEELREGFAALTQTGGIIADPRRPQEYYHNARVYEQRGDNAQAMRNYRAFFGFDELEFVDPHLRFQSFLKLQNGVAGAREVYYELERDSASVATAFAWNLLLDGDARVEGLSAFLEAHPEFAPAWYELSRDYSVARLGSQSMGDKRREKELLERFLGLQEEGHFLRYYLDQAVAAEQIEDAKERLAALSVIADEVLENPVSITATRSNQGWMVTVSIPDTVKEIFYRIGSEGEFRSTGHMAGVRSHAGFPLPNYAIEMGNAEKTIIQIKYTDPRDQEHGPFDVLFDPEVMLVQSMKGTLGMTKNSWLSFRDYDDKVLVYFTHLLSYRAILEEIRYGIDTETPDETFAFSPADPKNPYAVNPDDTIYLEVPKETTFATVQLLYKDGTASEVIRIER
ncbi:MAG: STY4199 family HEPN domain-containing protein [Planctomycetota bacterium]|jgi:methyl-accepting chemotaxis protein